MDPVTVQTQNNLLIEPPTELTDSLPFEDKITRCMRDPRFLQSETGKELIQSIGAVETGFEWE